MEIKTSNTLFKLLEKKKYEYHPVEFLFGIIDEDIIYEFSAVGINTSDDYISFKIKGPNIIYFSTLYSVNSIEDEVQSLYEHPFKWMKKKIYDSTWCQNKKVLIDSKYVTARICKEDIIDIYVTGTTMKATFNNNLILYSDDINSDTPFKINYVYED
jgi:hypothetical protein